MAVSAPSVKRSLGFAGLGGPLFLVVGLAACGDDGGSGQADVVIQPSSYSTLVSTTAPPAPAAGSGGAAGATVAGTQVYEVQRGDFIAGIADDYGIPPESIVRFNEWDDGLQHVIQPGDVINIPPGAELPAPEEEETNDESAEDTGSDDEADATDEEADSAGADDEPRCADGSRQGTYTVEAGDIPGNVAESLDVTPDQLDEANANTPGYRGFIVGIEILVPCGDDD